MSLASQWGDFLPYPLKVKIPYRPLFRKVLLDRVREPGLVAYTGPAIAKTGRVQVLGTSLAAGRRTGYKVEVLEPWILSLMTGAAEGSVSLVLEETETMTPEVVRDAAYRIVRRLVQLVAGCLMGASALSFLGLAHGLDGWAWGMTGLVLFIGSWLLVPSSGLALAARHMMGLNGD